MNHQCFWFKWDAFLFHEGLSGTCDRSLIQKSVSVIYGLTEALSFIYGLTEALSFIYFNLGLADELFKSRKNVGCLRFRTEVIIIMVDLKKVSGNSWKCTTSYVLLHLNQRSSFFATELFLHSLKISNLPKIYPRFAMVFQKFWNSVQIVNLLQLLVVDLYGKWNQLYFEELLDKIHYLANSR